MVKPTCMKEYSAHMKGIDRADQFLYVLSHSEENHEKYKKENSAVPYKLWTFQFL